MFKKFDLSSPLGIAISAAVLVLAFSPEARKNVRRLMVKSTAGVMDTIEHVGDITTGIIKKQSDVQSSIEVQNETESREVTSEITSINETEQLSESEDQNPPQK